VLTAFANSRRFSRLPALAALLSLAALALAACSATATPEVATASPAPAASSTATTVVSTTAPAATVTAPATATATDLPATATRTSAPSATPTTPATATDAATATATIPAASATSSQTIFNTPSIWDISSTVDSSGCSQPFVPPYGLVQITPSESGLQWHNTVPEDYTFTKATASTYTYAGPNGIGTGAVTLQVTFTSDTTLTLSQTFVSTAEPECVHTYTQTGTFQYFR
jgi:hypothetical protein